MDMISSLPDELLLIILSFLPTKYSLLTSILSSRWTYLFTYVPFLNLDIFSPDKIDDIASKNNSVDFDDYDNSPSFDFTTTTRINFINCVSYVLAHYNVNSMDKFRLHCGTAVDHRFHSWINSVIFRSVKEIDVFVVFRQPETLTREIFSCKMLSILKLNGNLLLEIPDSACLPCLKTLHLRRVSFIVLSGKVFSLSMFIVLEDLVLDDCILENADILDLSHPTIRKILIRRCQAYVLVIIAPSLLCFDFLESGVSEISGKTKLTSLVKACISLGYNFIHSSVINKLVRVVSHARHLHLCTETVEICGNPSSNLPEFSNLTCLEIGYVSRSAFASLLGLLNRSTHLEAIIFTKGFIASEWEDADLISFTSVPSCVSSYLKEVEFREFAMQESGFKFEGNFVEYLLRNCQFMKKLKIRFYKSRIEHDEFTKKLLIFPKCSRDCQILIDSNYAAKE